MVSIGPPSQRYKLTLAILFSIWLAVVIIAPFTLPYHAVDELSGKGGQVDNWREIDRMNPLAASAYVLGDMFCIEIADHSYYLNGNQMPFCARCTGIFVGLVIGMWIAVRFDPRVSIVLIGLAILPILIDGGLQLMTSYLSTNPLRVATGLLAGVAVSLYLSRAANGTSAPGKAQESETAE